MYQRVLLAYDGSREGRTALREGALLARKHGAQVFLLAIQTGGSGISMADAAHGGSALERQRTEFESIFQEAVQHLKRLGMEPIARLVQGEATAEIGKFAQEVDADLVVVGHRRQSLVDRWWSGASGAYILDNVACSLLIARTVVSDEEFNRQLAIIEGSLAR